MNRLFPVKFTQTPSFHPLPPNVIRSTISGPAGPLELLSTRPKARRGAPILFVHGGFGFPGVWLPWMNFLSKNGGYNCYAVGLRGHGASFVPSYFKMWAFTAKKDLAGDVAAAMQAVEDLEGQKPVLVGHSSSGGLVQLVLGTGMARARALVLAGAVPYFGSMGVYKNWFRLDPWFMLRSYAHLQHPRSPLSSTKLVKRAFFCDAFPDDHVAEFEKWMPEYESLAWPIGMMYPFLTAKEVLGGIDGLEKGGERVMVMAGTADRLMSPDIMSKMAQGYREALVELGRERQFVPDEAPKLASETIVSKDGYEARIEHLGGVQLAMVDGAGHHLQNDLQRQVGGQALLNFVGQL